jgi:S-adenosylmethionine:tRNA-ribosyltransferase-isomerase (queuine synthetase)
MFKEASRLKLRFPTPSGNLSTEQLWELPLNTLDVLAVNLEEEYKSSGKKSFLVAKSKKDKLIKLKFDVVVDILNSKVEERDAELVANDTKVHNQRILEKIAEKKDEALGSKSLKELEAMLK